MHNKPKHWLLWTKTFVFVLMLVCSNFAIAQIEDDEEDYGEDEGDWIIQDSLWEHSADTLAYY